MAFKDTYLYQVRRRNKPLFYVIIIFLLITLGTTLSVNEITPFYNWSMYAGITPATDTLPIVVLEYNKDKVFTAPHTWKDHKRMMFFYTMEHYTALLDNNDTDPDEIKARHILNKLHLAFPALPSLFCNETQMKAYPQWLKRYIQANTGEHIDSIRVYRRWVIFDNQGKVVPVKNELLFKA